MGLTPFGLSTHNITPLANEMSTGCITFLDQMQGIPRIRSDIGCDIGVSVSPLPLGGTFICDVHSGW